MSRVDAVRLSGRETPVTVSVPESGGDSSALAAGLVAVFPHCSCQCHVPG